MLASTMQFSRNNPTPPPEPIPATGSREDQPHTPTQSRGRVQPHNPIACLHLEPDALTRSIPKEY